MNSSVQSKLRLRSVALSFSVLALAGCAQSAIKPTAEATTPATITISGLTPEDRAAFFVNHARSGELDEVEKNLAAGANVDQIDSLGQTALIAAVSQNSLAGVKLLLSHKANPNLPDGSGWTPIIYGAYFGASDELLTELLKSGADINGRNDRGVTALFLASAAGHEELVKFLLSNGADKSIESTAGYSPLRIAKLRGQGRIVTLLDPSVATTQNKTSVH
ncbi:MAG: ankyrin repeat domain-containing protein [Pseudomonadota bacterium]